MDESEDEKNYMSWLEKKKIHPLNFITKIASFWFVCFLRGVGVLRFAWWEDSSARLCDRGIFLSRRPLVIGKDLPGNARL